MTIQADRPGGVPSLVDGWYAFLSRWGQEAVVLYAAFEKEALSLWRHLSLLARNWRARPRPEHPNPTLANAAWPVPLWLFYFVPQWVFGPLLDRFDQFVVASGSCHVALPLALRRRPYVLWMSTLYEDEIKGKMLVGDPWAEKVYRSPFWPFLAWQERFVLRRASRILSLSPYTRRRILEIVPDVADKLDVAMMPVDTERLSPLPPGMRRGDPPYLLHASRINDPRKNVPMLLEAFARIVGRYPDMKLVLVGDAPQPDLLARCEDLGLQDAVIFKGEVSSEELVDLYRRAELFLLSSTQEGLGIVIVEAMACGTPVVATDCGGPEGVVIEGETGRIVPNKDPEAFAQAVLDLLGRPEQLAAMREQCVAFVQENCARPIVEQKLYTHFVQTFPDSEAARRKLFEVPTMGLPSLEHEAEPPLYRLRLAVAALWSVFVFAVYMQHQMQIHWPAIRAQIVEPLLNAIR